METNSSCIDEAAGIDDRGGFTSSDDFKYDRTRWSPQALFKQSTILSTNKAYVAMQTIASDDQESIGQPRPSTSCHLKSAQKHQGNKTQEDMRLIPKKRCRLATSELLIKGRFLSPVGACEESLQDSAQMKVTQCGHTTFSMFDSQTMHIREIPQSLMIKIFSYLGTKALPCISTVCKCWHELVHDPELWRDIDLRGLLKVEDQTILQLTSLSQNVQSINISDSRLITDEGLADVVKNCPHLRCLKLRRCQHFSESSLVAIGENCRHLSLLDMDCCFGLTDAALQQIVEGCHRLETLVVNQCNQVTDKGITAIAENCPHLTSLSMAQLAKVGDDSLHAIADGCPKMKVLSFMASKFTCQGLSISLTKLHHLETLDLPSVECVRDDTVISFVRHCPLLRLLNVSLCTSVTDVSTHFLAIHAKYITSLYLVSCTITDKTLESLAQHSKQLESLDVGWCQAITDRGAIAMCEGCPRLRHLGLMRCDQVTTPVAEDLCQRFPNIHISTRWLDLNRLMKKVREQGIVFPGDLPRDVHFPNQPTK